MVLYTPSKTWVPTDMQQIITKNEQHAVDDDDRTSVFSMSTYGPLDWDHSGDELDKVQITPKISRRHSTLSGVPNHIIWTFPPKSSAKSEAASIQTRDRRGRFCRRTGSPTSSNVTQCITSGALGERDFPERLSKAPVFRAMSYNMPKSSPEQDERGRFRSKSEPPPTSKSVSMSDNSPSRETIQEQGVGGKLKNATTKTRRVSGKSPYFSPDPTPSKSSKSKAPRLDNMDDALIDDSVKNLSDFKPQTPRSPGEDSPSKHIPKRPRTSDSTVSCIPFPPLSSPTFGLIQEKLAGDPFRLLIAVTFLIRTHGKHAIPVFFKLMEKYPTPESLVAADKEEIVPIIRHLGLQNQRAGTYQMYANIWLENPPAKGRRYAVRGYPTKDSGRNIPKDEIINDTDEREAWEIGHMTQGPYALDSWRIFCRDRLRGVAQGWNGEATEGGFQPEWMRVVPEDKELRAFLRWMWLKEGFEWDPFTGEKEVASETLTRAAMAGRIAWDDKGGMRILDVPMAGPALIQNSNVKEENI